MAIVTIAQASGTRGAAIGQAAPDSTGRGGPETPSRLPADSLTSLRRAAAGVAVSRVEHPAGARNDLYQHASLAFASGLAIGLVSESPPAAAGGAISLGIVKELTDPRIDRLDLAADLLGAALAAWATQRLGR